MGAATAHWHEPAGFLAAGFASNRQLRTMPLQMMRMFSMTPERKARLKTARRNLLWVAAALALLLLGLDRYAAWRHRPDADDTGVVIYTTVWCPYCARLRAALDANAVPYVEYDVEKSLQGQMGFWALRGRGVPVSVIGPTVVYGYDIGRISRALGESGHMFTPLPPKVAPVAPAPGSAPQESRL